MRIADEHRGVHRQVIDTAGDREPRGYQQLRDDIVLNRRRRKRPRHLGCCAPKDTGPPSARNSQSLRRPMASGTSPSNQLWLHPHGEA